MGASYCLPETRIPQPELSRGDCRRHYVDRNWQEQCLNELALHTKDRHVNFEVLLQMYSALGGTDGTNSPVVLKGGAAAEICMRQEIAMLLHLHGVQFPHFRALAVKDIDLAVRDIDLYMAAYLHTTVSKLSALIKGIGIDVFLSENCTGWCIRSADGHIGDNFPDGAKGPRASLGTCPPWDDHVVKGKYIGNGEDPFNGRYKLLRLGVPMLDVRLGVPMLSWIHMIDLCCNESGRSRTDLSGAVTVMGMRVQSLRDQVKTARRMVFHDSDYQPLNTKMDNEKLSRKLECIVQLSFMVDFKNTWCPESGGTAAEEVISDLLRRWRQVGILLIQADHEQMYSVAEDSPPQLCYLLRLCARTRLVAIQLGESKKYDWWIVEIFLPVLKEMDLLIDVSW